MPEPQPMNPADVPQNLVDAATFAFAARSVASSDTDFTAYVRAMLAAALPIHAQQLGAKLGRLTIPCYRHSARPGFDNECIGCHRYSALIGARRHIEGRDTAAEAVRQLRADTKPAFIITTDDTLSEADAEKLRAAFQITARPAGPAGCARCGSPDHRLDDCPDYDPDDDYHGSYE